MPVEPYDGKVPNFPLPDPTAREAEVWAEIWRLPQAHAWALPSQRWRIHTIGMYVRQVVKCEAPDIGASQVAQVHRFADQIGMTDGGLAAMGWKVAVEEGKPASGPSTKRASSRDRLPQAHAKVSSLERARRRAEERS